MRFILNFETKLHLSPKSKDAGQVSLFKIHKGRLVFYSKDWAKSACQLGTFLGADEQGQCSFKHIFTNIYFEFQMPINNKVVCLEKMHNFGIWRFGSV
jgi:hypothetical protein